MSCRSGAKTGDRRDCLLPAPRLRAPRQGGRVSAAQHLRREEKLLPGAGWRSKCRSGTRPSPDAIEVISPTRQKSQRPLVQRAADRFESIRLSSYDDRDGGVRKPGGAFNRPIWTAPEAGLCPQCPHFRRKARSATARPGRGNYGDAGLVQPVVIHSI